MSINLQTVKLLFGLILGNCLFNSNLSAQTFGLNNFELEVAGEKTSGTSGSILWNDGSSGLTFVNAGGTGFFNSREISIINSNSQMVSFERSSNWFSSSTVKTVTIKSTSGNDFELTSLTVLLITSGSKSVKFEGYKDGVSTGFISQTISSSTQKTAVPLDPFKFSNIDEVRITGFADDGIRVDDILLAAPNIPVDNNNAVNNLPENSLAGTIVGITAFSKNLLGTTPIYSLTDNANDRFAINSSTGVVTATGLSLDYESVKSETITVKATVGTFNSSSTFTINISDVNEASTITSAKTLSIAENTTLVTTVLATDPEGTSPVFSIVGGPDQNKFTISPQGVLTFVDPPDFEHPSDHDANNTYSIIIRASDGTLWNEETFTITITDGSDSYFDNYAFRKTLTLNTNLLEISSNQTNFPALLRIQDDALIIRGNCSDIINSATTPNFAFVDPSNQDAELNYEIESYNSNTGVVLVWVKVPVLTATTPKNLYFYFGSNTVLTTKDAAFFRATWSNVTSGSKSYKGVWHFGEAAASAPHYLDATGNNNSLTSTATGINQTTSSPIGNGITLNNGAVANTAVSGIPKHNAAYTVSLWAYYPTNPSGSANLISLQNAGTNTGTQIGFNNSNGLNAWRWASSANALVKTSRPAAASWHHIAYTYTGTTSQLYVNGVLAHSSSSTAPHSGTPNLIAFGSYYNASNTPGGEYFNGSIDEAQIIDAALTADWIKASYINQKNPAAFTAYGTLETASPTLVAGSGYLTYTWTGAQNSVISNVNNWANTTGVSAIPVMSNKANWNIPSGLTNYPVLDDSYAINGLTVSPGASINLNGHNLSVACNVINNGQMVYNDKPNSKLTFNGATQTQTYTGNSNANSCSLGTLEINNALSGTVTLSGGLVQVHNLVSVTKGNLNSNGNLTLKASANSNANVGPLNGTSISGNVNVESFFSGGSMAYRSTRVISPPINDADLSSKTYTQLKNHVIITGPGGAAKGFDPGGASQPFAVSLTKYNEPATETQSQFSSVANLNESLAPGKAAFLYYRGSRDQYSVQTAGTSKKVNSPYVLPESTVVTYTGPINQGNIKVDLSYTPNPSDPRNGYNLVGNPYPSVINWENVIRVNVINELKVIKPAGGYATYMDGISVNADNLNLAYIQPGQGFYTRASSSGASITFQENSKSVTSTPVRLLSTNHSEYLTFEGIPTNTNHKVKSNRTAQLRLSLQDNANTEEAVSIFKPGSDLKAGSEDAMFFGGSTVSLSFLSSDNVKLSINSMPEVHNINELKLSVSATASGKVKLNFTDLSALEGFKIALQDNHLFKLTEIKDVSEYEFEIDLSDPATFGDNRLKLLFTKKPISPIGLEYFNVKAGTTNVNLNWETSWESDFEGFEIERSEDGESFSPIGTLKGNGNAAGYSFNDNNPLAGENYYRLKQLDKEGNVIYSRTEYVLFDLSTLKFSVFPNPAIDKIAVSLPNRNTSVKLVIYDLAGREIKSRQFNKQDSIEENVGNLSSGIYILKIFSNTNEALGVAKLIKQ